MKDIYIMGSINMDIVIEADKFPDEGETVVGKNFIINSGGKGANQAVAIAKQGFEPIFIGAVGCDIFGNQSLENLRSYGVNTMNIIEYNNAATGIATIIVHRGNNRIILDLGANLKLQLCDYINVLNDAKEGDLFVTQFETSPTNIIDAIKLAKEKKLITVVNPAPADKKIINGVLHCIDYLILNETELENLTGICLSSNKRMINAGRKLLCQGVGCVIITIGKNGCIALSDNMNVHIPAIEVQAIDSTAAGDTFVGVFCAELVNGLNAVDACIRATAAASITVTRRGAQQSIPNKSEIDVIMGNKGENE